MVHRLTLQQRQQLLQVTSFATAQQVGGVTFFCSAFPCSAWETRQKSLRS
jgi:hypothetical protein